MGRVRTSTRGLEDERRRRDDLLADLKKLRDDPKQGDLGREV